MAYATFDDVEARYKPLTAAQSVIVGQLLDDVETTIRSRITDLDAQVEAVPPTIDRAAVVKVEAWAVIRFLKNPDAKFQESIDDYSFTRDQALASGLLYVSDDEWRELLPGRFAAARSRRLVAYGDYS